MSKTLTSHGLSTGDFVAVSAALEQQHTHSTSAIYGYTEIDYLLEEPFSLTKKGPQFTGFSNLFEDLEQTELGTACDQTQERLQELFTEIDANPELSEPQRAALKQRATEIADTEWYRNEVVNSLGRGLLCIFIPACSLDHDGIPELHNACDTNSPEWQQFAGYLSQNAKDSHLQSKLAEIAENATYGGVGGIILPVSESTLKRWIASGDLLTACREDFLAGKQRPEWLPNKTTKEPRLWIGVLNWLNGSGHMQEVDCDWSKLQLPEANQWRVVNNLLDSTFGLVGVRGLSTGRGERWSRNPAITQW